MQNLSEISFLWKMVSDSFWITINPFGWNMTTLFAGIFVLFFEAIRSTSAFKEKKHKWNSFFKKLKEKVINYKPLVYFLGVSFLINYFHQPFTVYKSDQKTISDQGVSITSLENKLKTFKNNKNSKDKIIEQLVTYYSMGNELKTKGYQDLKYSVSNLLEESEKWDKGIIDYLHENGMDGYAIVYVDIEPCKYISFTGIRPELTVSYDKLTQRLKNLSSIIGKLQKCP